MTRRHLLRLSAAVFVGTASHAPLIAQTAAPPDSASATAEGAVRELYRLVSFAPGATTDWGKVRSLFLPEAVIFLRTSRTASTVFTLEGFIADFAAFDTLPAVVQNGFTETIVRLRPTVFRDIAHVLVLYEATIPGSPRPPQQGVDSFQLIRRDGRWWIVSVANDIVTPETPVPAELLP